MAAYKAEFLADYHQRHRRALGVTALARIHDLARLAQLAPRAANLAMNFPPSASLIKRALGMHQSRTVPPFAVQTFKRLCANRSAADDRRPAVVLFPDTFTNYFVPEVGMAAVRVLEGAGFRVIVPQTDLCCGRPLYDVGMLDRARTLLARALDVLDPMLGDEVSMVGLEPSCILTFRDELLRLFPADPRAKKLASRAMMLEEFLASTDPQKVRSPLAGKALLHGHCHQKAIAGIEPSIAVLKNSTALELKTLDAGCCGMAGAFGYMRNHFTLSEKIAERSLLPAVRASDPAAIVISDGFSCRTQLKQLCPGRRVLHLAQVLDPRASS